MTEKQDNQNQPDAIDRCVRHLERLAEEIPQEVVDRTRTRIITAIRAEDPRLSLRDRVERSFLGSTDPLLLWGAAATTVMFLTFGGAILYNEVRPEPEQVVVWTPPALAVKPVTVPAPDPVPRVAAHATPQPARPATEPEPAPQVVESTPASRPIEIVPSPAREPESGAITLAALQDEFKMLKESDSGITAEFLRKLNRHINEGGTIEARQLLVAAYEEMGERDLGLAAFEGLLDLVEKRDGVEQAAAETQRLANRLFYEQHDRLGALAYCDMLLARYPDSRLADSMRYLTCRYYELEGLPDQALAAYRDLRETGKGYVAWEADRGVAQVLYNTGKKEEAFAEVDGMIERHPENRAYLYYHKGMLLQAAGIEHYPAAVKAYKVVINEYAQTHYAGYSRNMLAFINKKMLGAPGDAML